jgi:hypothetical protein
MPTDTNGKLMVELEKTLILE